MAIPLSLLEREGICLYEGRRDYGRRGRCGPAMGR